MKNSIRYIIFTVNIFISISAFSQVIAVIGDFENTPVRVDSVSLLVKSWNPDVVASSGDLYDSNSGNIDAQIGQYYASFIYPYHGLYGPGAESNQLFPAIGNHDLSDISSFLAYFTLPGNGRYYSVQTGNVIFYILNSNPSESDGVTDTSAQAQWLQSQLAQAGDNWKIVVCHHPPYTSGPHPSTTYMQWPFASWGVNAVISGHNHFYERLFADGIPYFVNGSGGAVLYSFSTLIPESQFQYNDLWGAIKIQPYTDSLAFYFYNIRDTLIDRYVIEKSQTSINESMIVYPNVMCSNITIHFTGMINEPMSITIVDAEGRVINETENIFPVNSNCILNIPALRSGIYFVNIKSKNHCLSGKFSVIK